MRKGVRSIKNNVFITSVIYVGLVLLMSLCITNFVGQRAVVDGDSMLNTLTDGDNLIVNKLKYKYSDPERFDVIVFPNPNIESSYLIKRIIALPGETIKINKRGFILINDIPMVETYGREMIKDAGAAVEEIILGEDEYFVLGDNRNYSADSRDLSIGNVKRKNIIGEVSLRIWPLDKFGGIE